MSLDQPQPPAQNQPNAYVPVTIPPIVFQDWMGINTSPTRVGIDDKQAYWIDGFFPIDEKTLRTMYGVGTALYTAGGGRTIIFFNFYNLGSTPYAAVFLDDGSVVQVNVNTQATTTILSAATITTPSIVTVGTTQWGNQYLIIVSSQTNGYWVWDGTLVYKAGTISPIITVTNTGSGYQSTPTVTLSGGRGSGSSLVATMSLGMVISVSVVNPGSGYLAGDSVTVNFAPAPQGGTGASITATLASFPGVGFSLNSLVIVAGGSLYSNPTLVFSGGSGLVSNPSAFAILTGGCITGTSITARGVYTGSASPTVSITDAAVTATAVALLMPLGIQGTTIETYQGHVWVANAAVVYLSAPGSFADFSTSSGGGNFTSNDSFLKVGYSALINSNGFLWLIGDSSVNYISGVQTSGSPPTTTFSNQNADPEVGSPYPASVETFGRDVLMANAYGVHVINGSNVVKISEPLDGVWTTVASFGNLQLASSKAIVFGKKIWMVLNKIVDPVSGSTVNKLFIWFNKKWFASAQDMTLTYIKHLEINSVITAYGTDGSTIKPLFNTASTGFQKVAQSKLWGTPADTMMTKVNSRFWGAGVYASTLSPNMIVSIDSEANASPYSAPASPATFTITGPTSVGYFVIPPQAVGQQGKFTGMTIRTSSADMTLVQGMTNDIPVQYRA